MYKTMWMVGFVGMLCLIGAWLQWVVENVWHDVNYFACVGLLGLWALLVPEKVKFLLPVALILATGYIWIF